MTSWIAQALGLVLLGQAGAAGVQENVVLTCSILRPALTANRAPAGVVREDRIFRLGPGAFQEWSREERRFGSNLCRPFSCVAAPDRSEGTLDTGSGIYTIGIDHKTGVGYWRAQGMTGLAETAGVCRKTSDPSAPGS